MKKILTIVLLLSLFIPFLGVLAQEEGLVPCGNEGQPSCGFCDFFALFKRVLDFVLQLVIVIAVLMIVVGGAMVFLAGADPKNLEKGKAILKSTAIGLVIVFSSWILVNTIFMFIGIADWTGLREGWFKIDCL